MHVKCVSNAKFTLLFSHGNAVDLGQMSSFFIGLGSFWTIFFMKIILKLRHPLTCKYNELRLLWIWTKLRKSKWVEFEQSVRCRLRKITRAIFGQARPSHFIRAVNRHRYGSIFLSKPSRFRMRFVNRLKLTFQITRFSVPTTDLATKVECAAVILHSPLSSGFRVLFPTSKRTWFFDTFKK